MIGYYIHHHGFGHLARAMSVCARMRRPVTAMTSLDVPEPHPFSEVMRLPRDDEGPQPREATAHGALHWAPHHDAGLSARMNQIARWVSDARPEAVVVDVSVEVALFIRLLGVPVIVVALPGSRVDAPHVLVHRLADHIVAAWPRALCVPSWLRQWEDKTSYVGGISRFEGRDRRGDEPESSARPLKETRVVVLGGPAAHSEPRCRTAPQRIRSGHGRRSAARPVRGNMTRGPRSSGRMSSSPTRVRAALLMSPRRDVPL